MYRGSDAGGYREYEENEFGVDVHTQGLEREVMKGLDSCAPIPQTTLFESCFVGADVVIYFTGFELFFFLWDSLRLSRIQICWRSVDYVGGNFAHGSFWCAYPSAIFLSDDQ